MIGALAALSPAPAGAEPALVPQAVPLVTKTISLKNPGTLAAPGIGSPGSTTAAQRRGWAPPPVAMVRASSGARATASKCRTRPGGTSTRRRSGSRITATPASTWDRSNCRQKYLHQGIYFQWQNPIALADGTVVLTSTTIDSPGLLLLSPKKTLKRVPMDRYVAVVISDGHPLRLRRDQPEGDAGNPRTGAITTVSPSSGRVDGRFTISFGGRPPVVTRPGVNLRLNLVGPSHPTLTVHPASRSAMGATGKLWVLVNGYRRSRRGRRPDGGGLFSVNRRCRLGSVAIADPNQRRRSGRRVQTWACDWAAAADPDVHRPRRRAGVPEGVAFSA